MNKGFGASLAAVAFVLGLVACAGHASDDGSPATGDDQNVTGSKLTAAEQASAKLDDNGVCRTSDGKFADPAFCNLSDNECKDVDNNTQADGICRHPDGKFAVAICCTELCGGAKLSKDASGGQFHCRGTDGTFVPAACCNKAASGIPLANLTD
jgi:hypothetical protein